MKRINSLIVLSILFVCFSCKKDFQDVNAGQIKVTEEDPLFVKDNDTIFAELLATCEYSGTIRQLTVQVGFTEDLVDATSMAATKTDDGYVATFPVQIDTVYYYRYVVHRYSTEFDQITEWEDEKIHKLSTDDLLLPTVSTVDVSFVSTTSAMGCGLVTNEGGQIIEQGFCWSTHPKPKISDNYENNAIGEEEMFVQMGGLSSGTTYYTRAYAKSSKGIAYSDNEVCFKTKTSDLVVETKDPTGITDTSVTLRINISRPSSSNNNTYQTTNMHYGYLFGTNPLTKNPFPQLYTGYVVDVNKEYSVSNLDNSSTYFYRTYVVFDIINDDTIYGGLKSFTTLASSELPTGELNGAFSVSPTQQVEFSPGNLQYQASNNKWRFAHQQWEYIGDNNKNLSATYYGWIDLFGWGTSGNNHGSVCYQPWSTSYSYSDYYAYGLVDYNLNDQTGLADWGSNTIYLGNQATEGWRALTSNEWNYLFNTRITSSGMRYAKAQLDIANGTDDTTVNGIIIFPDDWIDNDLIYQPNTPEASYTSNVIFDSNWKEDYEAKGAVFLPACGRRLGSNVYDINDDNRGYYWSSSKYDGRVYLLYYTNEIFEASSIDWRYYGQSVRLVRDL